MAQKGIIINTVAPNHVDAQDFAKIITGLTQTTACIINTGDIVSITKQTNNAIRLTKGMIVMSNGVAIRIEDNEDVVVTSGTLGYKRYDLLIAEYIKNGESEGTDIARIRVVQGDYSAGNPTKPSLKNDEETRQDLLATMLVEPTNMTLESVDVPLFEHLNGSIIKTITLNSTGWTSSGLYTINDSLITATSNQELLPPIQVSDAMYDILMDAKIIDYSQAKGSMTIKALGTIPTSNLQVRIIYRGKI